MSGHKVEFVGGPRDGEQRVVEDIARAIRFSVNRGRNKPPSVILYRKRAGFRSKRGVTYYDYTPPVAA